MDWQDIIRRGSLFYASREVDDQLRTWSLKVHECNVSWYEEVPLDDIDSVICSVLSKNGGSMSEVRLASILGFSVEDDFESIPRKYADKAELNLFRAILKTVTDWGLVQVNQEDGEVIIALSFIGEKALRTETKYNFYKGTMSLYENFGLNSQNEEENELFQFKEALGLSNAISNIHKIAFADVTPENFNKDRSQLACRLLSQSTKHYNLSSAVLTSIYKISSCHVDIRVYFCDNNYYPIVFNNDDLSIAATELINNSQNTSIKANKIEWAQYLHLLNDPDAILNYDNLAPFSDILTLDNIIADSRLDWSDKKLFQYIKETANGNDWLKISSSWPINVIEGYLAESKHWNWSVISKRITPAFLIANINNYCWDFRSISHREDLDESTIVALLDSTESATADWDWDNLMPLLDNQYIIQNISRINFDLSEFTKNEIETAVTLIPNNADKSWDWIYISKYYDLGFILKHIQTFETKDDEGKIGNRLCLSIVIDRAFSSEQYADAFSLSEDFSNAIKNNRLSLNCFSANSRNYIWSNSVISLFESLEFISWTSGRYTTGFECNPHLDWSLTFFKDYHYKIATQKGYSHVSSRIKNPVIIDTYQDFCWDWEALSDNSTLVAEESFVRTYINKLNLSKVLVKHNSNFIEDLFEHHNLVAIIATEEVWRIVSEKVSIEFIRKHIDYNWNWCVLTARFYSSIKIALLGDNRWRDKWDWNFLTKHLPNDIIMSYIAEYQDKWDWSYISAMFDKEFIIEHLPSFVEYWDWATLLTSRFTKDDLGFLTYLPLIGTCISRLPEDKKTICWTIITQKFSFQELFDLIEQTHTFDMTDIFCWDYLEFYNREEFYLRNYITEHTSYVNWDAISSCNKIHEEFTWDRTLFSENVWLSETISLLKNREYHWNFKALSQIKSLNSHFQILSIKSPLWDWGHITEFSSLFKKGEYFKRNFKRFSKHLKYEILSSRTDSGLTENLIASALDKPWDWKLLSSNTSVKLTIGFIKEHQDKDWDWQALSSRKDIEFDNQTLLDLSDKDWSWIDISHRTDLVYDEEFIANFIEKPLDWFLLSSSDKFTPNVHTLSKLKGQRLSWDSISSNPKLSKAVLWDYRDMLNWKLVTINLCDFSDPEYLQKYEDYLDWTIISKNSSFVVDDGNLYRFKDRVIWSDINKREDFKLTTQTLDLFSDHIDWSKASASLDLDFTEELIEKYRDKWNWKELRQNSKILSQLNDSLRKYKAELNCADFIERFSHTPYIYHFTHLFNAVEIIRNRKILSRNLAKGKFANAAGLNVNIRDTAHSFARFYYRTQTPTQFYNECLGMDSESGYWKEWYYYGYHRKWKSYYSQALSNGLPKCPMPVFFKFDLSEVISRNPDTSYYSTGNMQTSWAEVVKVTDDPTRLNTSHIDSTIKDGVDIYKMYSQQEFLVLNQLDFTDVNFLEIICYDEAQADLLRSQLQGDPICERITTYNYGIFHRNNRQLTIFEDENKVKIESEYRDNAFLVLNGEGASNVKITNPENIRKETPYSVSSYPSIEFHKTNEPIEVHFIDEIGRDWLVYKN